MFEEEVFISESLPEPLSKTELIKYIALSKKGNIEARNKVILHNIKLVINHVLINFSRTPYEMSEMVSVGIEGLIRAIDYYDETRNIEFSTYATKCIHNSILKYIKEKKELDKVLSLNEPLAYITDVRPITLEDVLPDNNSDIVEQYEDRELILFLQKEINELKYPEKQIMLLYFGFYNNKWYLQREIGQMLYMTKANVARILIKNLTEISQKLYRHGFIENKDNKWVLAYKKRYK